MDPKEKYITFTVITEGTASCVPLVPMPGRRPESLPQYIIVSGIRKLWTRRPRAQDCTRDHHVVNSLVANCRYTDNAAIGQYARMMVPSRTGR